MDFADFERALGRALAHARRGAEEMTQRELPVAEAILIAPRCSYDGDLKPGEVVLEGDGPEAPVTPAEAAAWMWRDGRVPVWIDVFVIGLVDGRLLFRAECAGRFTNVGALLYHRETGLPPFHPLSPIFPPGWTSVEKDGPIVLDEDEEVRATWEQYARWESEPG